MTLHDSNIPSDLDIALQLLCLTEPFSYEMLTKQYHDARRAWYPPRYAGLTNNPSQYMEMYKKGEAKTKEIQKAYELLLTHLQTQQLPLKKKD